MLPHKGLKKNQKKLVNQESNDQTEEKLNFTEEGMPIYPTENSENKER